MIAAARARSVGLHGVSRYRTGEPSARCELVIGFGNVAEEVDGSDGTGVVRAEFYRHWPRGYYVTTKAAAVMHR